MSLVCSFAVELLVTMLTDVPGDLLAPAMDHTHVQTQTLPRPVLPAAHVTHHELEALGVRLLVLIVLILEPGDVFAVRAGVGARVADVGVELAAQCGHVLVSLARCVKPRTAVTTKVVSSLGGLLPEVCISHCGLRRIQGSTTQHQVPAPVLLLKLLQSVLPLHTVRNTQNGLQ